MSVRPSLARLFAAMLMLAAAVLVLARGGVASGTAAVPTARKALAALGFVTRGDPTLDLEVDQSLAWALERSRPGPVGVALARRDSGAVRWHLRFPEGGEAIVTAGGRLWSVRRPIPSAPGADVLPWRAKALVEQGLPIIAEDASRWALFRSQSWREEGHLWYRARFLGGSGNLPSGWRREAEVRVAGSTVVEAHRWVQPLGTDLGVVMGREEELGALRRPAMLAIAVVVLGILLTGAESFAFYERVAPVAGMGVCLLAFAIGAFADVPQGTLVAQAVVAGLAVAVMPSWTSLPAGRARMGPVVGAVAAAALVVAPAIAVGVGGWMPARVPFPEIPSPWRLLGDAWLPAMVEEPVLRGAIPGLVAPVLGWWGGALLGAGVGALLHPVPAVPLLASLIVELVLQAGMVLAARWGGVSAAVLARGTCEALLRRQVFPSGPEWNAVAMVGVLAGVVLLGWPRKS